MQMTVNLPDTLELTKADIQLMLATKLFETRKLPLGKAARVAGMSYREFYDLLTSKDIPVFEWNESYIREEIKNAGL
jgi:predicted HTH domain antitoxin